MLTPRPRFLEKKERICLKLSIPLVFLKVSVTCLFVYIFVNLYSNCFFYYYFSQFGYFFQSLRKVGQDPIVLLMCITVFLSYLPEAGQYSCMFIYLKQVRHSDSLNYLHALPTTSDQWFFPACSVIN